MGSYKRKAFSGLQQVREGFSIKGITERKMTG